MKLGTQTGSLYAMGLSEEEGARLLSELGFDSVDYSLMAWYTSPIWSLSDEELKARMIATRKRYNDNGIVIGQTHSPMDALWTQEPETKEARLHAQIQAIKATAWLGSPYVVIHPLMPPCRVHKQGMEETKALNMEFYHFLRPYLEEYNVKAAIENLGAFDPILGRLCETACSSAEELIDYIETLGSDRFVACLDVGHAAISGQDPVSMIYALGKKHLHVTHIHDNNHLGDDHNMPGMGMLDWYGIGKALNDIGFDEVFNYEADTPYFEVAPYCKELCLPILKTYAEVGKAIIKVK